MTKFSPKDLDAIVALLTRIYLEIAELESRFGLIAGEGDMRPRIDYFHDAVRAYTAGGNEKRLTVELLAYDLQALRFIQQTPLAPFKPNGQNLSPSHGIMTAGPGLAPQTAKPDRATRERIAELYQHYNVLFAALLKPAADHDYHERADSLNNDVQDVHAIIQQFEGKMHVDIIVALTHQLEEAELRYIVTAFMQSGKHTSTSEVKKLVGHLKDKVKANDAALAALDKTHLNFATAQLAIFEDAKDMLKKLAAQGMNLVGKFVASAMAEAKQQQRGR